MPVAAPVAVESFDGSLSDERVPVRAPPSASSPDAPLIAVDREARVAAVGGESVGDGSFEESGAEPFLTALLDSLSARTPAGEAAVAPDVLWDGGHGQFDASRARSVEAASAYQRYLEGVGPGLEQVNDYGELLARGRGLVVTAPATGFDPAELDALRSFRNAGGSVVVVGGAVSTDRIGHCNGVLAELGSDLTLGTEPVTDPNGTDGVVEVAALTESFDLFDAFDPATGGQTDSETESTEDTQTGDERTETETPGFGAVSVLGGAALALRRLRED